MLNQWSGVEDHLAAFDGAHVAHAAHQADFECLVCSQRQSVSRMTPRLLTEGIHRQRFWALVCSAVELNFCRGLEILTTVGTNHLSPSLGFHCLRL